MTTPKWQLDGALARLTLGPLRAELDLARPGKGLHRLHHANSPIAGAILGVAVAPVSPDDERSPIETYVRDGDLVVTYPQTPDSPFRLQVYWRIVVDELHPNDVALEQIISVQTTLLDSRPEVSAFTLLAANAVGRVTDDPEFIPIDVTGKDQKSDRSRCILFRNDNDGFSYAAISLPADFSGASLRREDSGLIVLRQTVLAQWLEKGVIVRARQLGVFTDRTNDTAAAVAWYQTLRDSPLPLTV